MQLQAEGSFNSMKVRLKRDLQHVARSSYAFQFHEGPIKTFSLGSAQRKNIKFQFHEGPIKTMYWCVHQHHAREFQFHEGPIKTFFSEDNAFRSWQVSIP